MRLVYHDSCRGGKDVIVEDMWYEAQLLAEALAKGYNDNKYKKIFQAWLGMAYDSDQYKKSVDDTVSKAANIYTNKVKQNQEVHFYCNPDWCNKDEKGVPAISKSAKTWDDVNYESGRLTHHIFLCDRTLARGMMRDRLKLYDNKSADSARLRQDIGTFETVRAKTLFHETLHFQTVQYDPPLQDWAYGSEGAWFLVKTVGEKNSTRNVDSFVMPALAVRVQDYYGLSEPPGNTQGDGFKIPAAPGPSDVDSIVEDLQPPPGWTYPPASEFYQLGNDVRCNGVEDSHWMDPDWLYGSITTFCIDAARQGVQDKDAGGLSRYYNNGNQAVTLSVDWPSGEPWHTPGDCFGIMKSIADVCDGNDSHNPLNWKRGGQRDSGNARYRIAPTTHEYNTGSCTFHLNETKKYSTGDAITGNKPTYSVSLSMNDGIGAFFGDSGGYHVGDEITPYSFSGLYQQLKVWPSTRTDEHVTFGIDKHRWTSNDGLDKAYGCGVGAWDGGSPVNGRQMDCHFPC